MVSPKLLNLLNTVIFLIGAAVMSVAIYYLVSDMSKFLDDWWLWVGLFSGVLLMVLGLMGCTILKKPKKSHVLGFWFISGLLVVAFTIAAIGASIYYSDADDLSKLTGDQLNHVSGDNREVYESVRTSYGDLWSSESCVGGVCDIANRNCATVTCKSSSVQDQFNTWIKDGMPQTTPDAFELCRSITVGQAGYKDNGNADSAWCAGNTAVMDDVRDISWGLMTGLWIVASFMMLLVLLHIVMHRKSMHPKPDPVTISAATAADEPASVQV